MIRMLGAAVLVVALFTDAWGQGAGSRVPDADAKAIRAVVQAQLDAFAADDGPKAFSLASPGIRTQFGIPEVFMAMVREGYAVVYRPASTTFLPAYREAGQVFQPVRLTDGGGLVWIAHYRMEKQKSGVWRIGGCSVARTGDTSAQAGSAVPNAFL